MDYSEIVKAISELHGVPNMDKEYELFYDETNNSRIFKLTEDGFNYDEKAYFILGGIVFNKSSEPNKESIDNMLERLQVPQNSSEVKFKHIKQKANGFIDLISKSRVKELIAWLYENNLWIHYSYRDNFYYSIVDIIDSLPESTFGGMEFNRDLKNSLFNYIEGDKEWFLQYLKYFDYPNVKNHEQFIDVLLNWIENINPDRGDFNIEYLRQSLNTHREEVLVFLSDNLDGILIQDYSDIYINSILTYYNSNHTFDEELEIQKKIEGTSIEVFGKEASYKFIDSESSIFVQISDLVVGILRMWMAFLENSSILELKIILSSLSEIQRKTLKVFQVILNNSLFESFGFKHGSGSIHFDEKINFFMEYQWN